MLNNSTSPGFGHFQSDNTNKAPTLNFKIQDNRCDPLVSVALKALEGALSNTGESERSLQTAIFSVTDTGCQHHAKRVIDALATMRPRQAFFARGSAIMLSTYSSMAIGSHGPCLSMSGRGTAIALVLNLAKHFLTKGDCHRIILLCADQIDGALKASAVYFSSANTGEIDNLIEYSLDTDNVGLYAESIIQSFFSRENLV
ncbi:hypothetical protein SAMN04490207_1440 [Pseudomonas gessardii]|uniref:Beta-ketoacyl synthase-like N-terminal domain-containing protein n=1 Tax=Pseudomonas gessardii TaxID=78544 RepID=A0A7Y1QNX5_9PSED|nr:beta-ketoacyl synthase N-terminal-like domain-containing protein [Pseudomonas gessardii]MRU52983.1 hypothetical protein [Pseudomonas gessardii]NNA97233.1 hypothetical protein [Pseudomonas gessardii]SDQ67960.1 hypothetical protein SAMN04490207_1440 [Pseudomonas gessardii]